MTLIELLAGLVVLGTVLASIGMARGRFLRQWAEADRRLAATRAVDHLLERWMSGPAERIPLAAQGELYGMTRHVWRTTPRRDRAAEALGLTIVRLDVFDRATEPRAGAAPVVSVEFLVPQIAQEQR
jgi:hypothetical protein